MTEFRYGGIAAKSLHVCQVSDFHEDKFDLVILFNSIDDRCKIMTKNENIRTKYSLFFDFDLLDEIHASDNRTHIDHYLRRITDKKQYKIQLKHADITETLAQLNKVINEIVKEEKNFLNILIDINSSPHIYFLYMLNTYLNEYIAARMVFFYSEVIYPEDKINVFTEGKWEIIKIPGMYEIEDEVKKSHFIITLGLEGSKTYRAISREDPEKITVFFPRPGAIKRYEKRAWKENRELLEEFKLKPCDNLIFSKSSDPILLWKKLKLSKKINFDTHNIYYMSFGTKAMALGLGLYFLTEESRGSFLYAIPEKFTIKNNMKPVNHWYYIIENKSAILL